MNHQIFGEQVVPRDLGILDSRHPASGSALLLLVTSLRQQQVLSDTVRARFTVSGVVQGVGFRPFVHRLASDLGLSGFVGNDARSVFIEVQGPARTVAEFERRLRARRAADGGDR